jgi:hypothetical protein
MLIIHFERKIGKIKKNPREFKRKIFFLFRYFSYSPRTTAPSSTKYHSYAFIYLQNAIERAIINVHTGRNISYGIQTQQMPYPCWINDKYVCLF